jgi:hypothetical protein
MNRSVDNMLNDETNVISLRTEIVISSNEPLWNELEQSQSSVYISPQVFETTQVRQNFECSCGFNTPSHRRINNHLNCNPSCKLTCLACFATLRSGWGYSVHISKWFPVDENTDSSPFITHEIGNKTLPDTTLPVLDKFCALSMKLTSEKRVPASTVDVIFQSMKDVFKEFQSSQYSEMKQEANRIQDRLDIFTSAQGRENYINELFNMIPLRDVSFPSGGRAYFLGLFDILRFLFLFPEVYAFIEKEPPDVCQGSYGLKWSRGGRGTVYLGIYGDDLEICNPIGKFRGKHKLTVLYLQLLNIPGQYRSKPNSIIPLCCAKYVDIARNPSVNLKLMLHDFIDSINVLASSGKSFAVSNTSILVKGVASLLSGRFSVLQFHCWL